MITSLIKKAFHRWTSPLLEAGTWRQYQAWVNLLVLALLGYLLFETIKWSVFQAHRPIDGVCLPQSPGACWEAITQNLYLLFFGVYPFEFFYQSALGALLLLLAVVLIAIPRFWNLYGLLLFAILLFCSLAIMGGWFFGHSVSTVRWSGLPLTLLLSIVSVSTAFPIAILLALGRRSKSVILRWVCALFVESIRGVPIVSILFVASFLLPLVLPPSFGRIDTLLRVCIGLSFFTSAYLSEVIRGSLRALPDGQWEVSQALNLSYFQMQRKIILPQILSLSIPGITNIVIGILKNTSLVLVVGLFDFLNGAKSIYTDPSWASAFTEVLLVTAFVYFVLCNLIARYGIFLEKRFNQRA